MSVRDYKELIVWQKSMDLADIIYDLVNSFPKSENYILTDQIKRAVLSVPSNIAEGSRRTGGREFSRFISIARGSLGEVETQLLFACRRKFVSEQLCKEIIEKIEIISKMLWKLQESLKVNN